MRKISSLGIIALTVIIFIVGWINYKPGTFLTGWDNLHPEFNFNLNIFRSLFASWQEYQGLGLLGGMGHAADLPRQVFLWLISLFLPVHSLRYFYHLLMLFVGSLGIYFLLKEIILEKFHNREAASLVGAIFYLFNFATLQMFHVPFEPYSTHYGFLPWLFFANLHFLQTGTKKSLLFLLIINILAIPQGYVATFFLVFVTVLSIVFLAFSLVTKAIKRIIIAYTVLFLVNAFWLLPNLYFFVTKTDVNVSAKINQMSTEDNFLNNKRYGNLANTTLLKGFWFDNVEMDKEGILRYQLEDWKKHLDNPLISIVGYSLFILAAIGIYYSFQKKIKNALLFVPVLLFSFTVLSNDTPIFSFFASLFYKIPLFSQIFRFPFTKFAILTAFCFSIFYAITFVVLASDLKRKFSQGALLFIFILIPIFFLSPIFSSHLFYDKTRTEIPQEYFKIFDFFKSQDKTSRIANFPQYTFWGWTFYRWNYSGSGFLWYGIQQPILDRAFDVWSSENENYYHEISQAIYSSNKDLFETVLEKYQVSWLLIDESVLTYSSAKALYLNQLEEIIDKSSKIKLEQAFGKVKVYRVNLENKLDNFVFLISDLPVVGPTYRWNNLDRAFVEYGHYLSLPTHGTPKYASLDSRFTSTQSRSATSGQGNYDKAYEEYGNYVTNDNLFSGGAGLFVEGDIHKENDDRHKESNNQESSVKINKQRFAHNFSEKLSIMTDIIKNNIALMTSYVNKITFAAEFSGRKLGASMITPIKPADKLVNKPDKTLAQDLAKNILTINTLANEIGGSQLAGDLIYYPFRSLFTGRKQEELEFEVTDQGDYFSFKSKIPKELASGKLTIPQLNKEEVEEVDENGIPTSTIQIPQVYLDGELISLSDSSTSGESSEGNLEVRVPKINGLYSYDSKKEEGLVEYTPRNCDQFNRGMYTHEKIEEDGKSLLRLTSIGSSNCLDFDIPQLSQRLGYVATVENRNIEGKSLLFGITNKNSQRSDVETYLPQRISKSYFIIPPMEKYALGYTLHFDNISIGRVKTVNDLGRITVNPIPYKFLTELKIIKGDPLRLQGVSLKNLQYTVEHPNPSFYEIRISDSSTIGGVHSATPEVSSSQTNNVTLVLSQSYDSGWRAYQVTNDLFLDSWYMKLLIPFFHRELSNHVLVNNWENGWKLSDNKEQITNNKENTIIIVYLPQYLEYIGFGLLLFIPFLFISPRHSHLL